MTQEDRIRFRDFLFQALMVREEIDADVAMERANNISMGIDADFEVVAKREATPTGYELHEMEEHAKKVIT